MKTFKLSMIALLLLLGVYACKKDSSTASTDAVTTDQAADLAAGSLASNSNGLASITDDISSNATAVTAANSGLAIDAAGTNPTTVKQECGTTLSDSSSNQGSADSVTWSYFRKYSHTLNCNVSSKPDNIINRLTFSGNYSGPNVTSSDSGTANVTIGDLEPDSTHFLVNGEYKRSGSFTSKIGNKASGSKSVDIVVTNLTLSKPARKITGGTATINISVTVPKGTFTYTGNLVFNGDGSAVLTINGTSYTIDLHTGFRIRR